MVVNHRSFFIKSLYLSRQIIIMSLDKDLNIENYILSHIDEEPELLRQLNRDAHVNLLKPPVCCRDICRGRMLKMFCRMLQPKYILEIGTYTAYATLCLAEGVAEDAEIHTIEVNDELEDFIMKHLYKSKLKDRIHLYIGDAMQIIPSIDERSIWCL